MLDYREIDALPESVFEDWQAYEQIEPFGAWRDNYHAAMIASILANVYRKKGTKRMSINDFFFEDKITSDARKRANIIKMFKGMMHNAG